jgi:hypothetical protein
LSNNPHKWKYDPNDITILNAGLDSLASRLEIEAEAIVELEARKYAKREIKFLRDAINAIYELSNQQQHLIVGIEKLKDKLKQQK